MSGANLCQVTFNKYLLRGDVTPKNHAPKIFYKTPQIPHSSSFTFRTSNFCSQSSNIFLQFLASFRAMLLKFLTHSFAPNPMASKKASSSTQKDQLIAPKMTGVAPSSSQTQPRRSILLTAAQHTRPANRGICAFFAHPRPPL